MSLSKKEYIKQRERDSKLKPNAEADTWIKILTDEKYKELKTKTKGFKAINCNEFPKTPKKKKVDEVFNVKKIPRLLITQENANSFFKYQLKQDKNAKQNTKQKEIIVQGKALC